MTRISSRNFSVIVLSAILLIFNAFSTNITAQAKKSSAQKNKSQTANKSTDKKTATAAKTNDKKEKSAKEKKSASDRNAAAKTDKSIKTNSKKQIEDKRLAKIREAEETKRRAVEDARRRAEEEARRQAIAEERRRREQAAREARARKVAFERGLRSETFENIMNDDVEGEDLEVRRAAVNALGKHAGTVVVMEAQTGKVLTIVNQKWGVRKGFKPCSTIKLVTAVAGINEDLITEEGNIRSRRFPMNLDDALAYSNNGYFQVVGSNLGNQKMISYAQNLGLGQPTGINSEGETSGKLPFGNKNARIYSHGDDFEVSPLQLAVMVSAISNGGKVVVPRVPRTKFEKSNFQGTMRRQVKLPVNNLEGVIPGMIGAAEYGTARRGVDHSLGVAGKTGSCIAEGSWVGLFASVAPIENPQYAVVVITRGEGERGKYAAAIAGKIYDAVRSRMTQNGAQNIARVPVKLKPETKISARESAMLDEGEDEEAVDVEEAAVARKEAPKQENAVKQTVAAPQPTPRIIAANTQQPAIKTGEKSAGLFPPIIINVKKSRSRYAPNK